MEIILSIFYIAVFILLIYKIKFFTPEGTSWKSISLVFLLKIFAGLVMYFIYTYYYTDRATADIFKYFDDSKVMYDAFWNKPVDFFKMLFSIQNDTPYFDQYYHQMNNWYRVYESNIYNDSHTIIRLNAVMRFFSFGYYKVHIVFMCFLSLTGLVGLYRFFLPYFSDKKRLLFFAVFLIPSVVFWSSGVLKEAILLFGMGILLYSLHQIFEKRKLLIAIIFAGFSILILMYTKFYIFTILIPLIISYIWCKYTRNKFCFLKYALVLTVVILAGLNLHHIFPDYNVLKIIAMKQNDFVGLAKAMRSGSLIDDSLLEPDLFKILLLTPLAFFNTLIRPYIFEANNALMLFSAIENVFILFFIVLCVVFSNRKHIQINLFLFCLFFFVLTFILTGLTTPVIGAMVRYKVPALPFLMIVFISLLDNQKVAKRLPFLRNIMK